MAIRDKDGTAIAVQRLTPRNDSESVLLDLRVARNEILDLMESFEAIALLARRCPMLAEVEDWRAESQERLESLARRLSKLGRSYGGKEEIPSEMMERCTDALEQLDPFLEAGDGELFVLMGRQAERVVRTVLAVVEGREGGEGERVGSGATGEESS